jgi:hypothetical protein
MPSDFHIDTTERGADMLAMTVASPERSAPAGQSEQTPTDEGHVVDRLLRCVSSGYLSGGCSCRSAIPSSVVTAAWASVLAHEHESRDRFFRFAWRGGVWLAFGLQDGRVRGVYCPEHSAARAERCPAPDLGVAS